MKQPTIITKVVMLVIFLAGVVYLVGAAWQIFTDPFSTIMTYEYTVDDAAEATGWLVRTEQVIPGQGSIVDVLPDQGEKHIWKKMDYYKYTLRGLRPIERGVYL